MKENINSIISIDNSTKEVVKETEDKINLIRENLRESLTNMENESNDRAKALAMEEYDKILNKFQRDAEEKKMENDKRLEKIEGLYNKKREDIIKKAFDLIISPGN